MVSAHLADLAIVLCRLAAIALASIGVLALIAPERLARSYGIEVHERAALAFVRATGARDVLIGLILAGAAYLQDAIVLAGLCIVGVLLSLADFAIAFTFARRFRSEHLAHIGGAVGFALITALLLSLIRR